MLKNSNHTEEVRLYLDKGETQKAYSISLIQRGLILIAIIVGALALPATRDAIGAIFRAF